MGFDFKENMTGAEKNRAVMEYERRRAVKIALKKEKDAVKEYVAKEMSKMLQPSMQRIAEMIESKDEDVATKNSHFVINHAIGTPTSKTISQSNVNVHIDFLAE